MSESILFAYNPRETNGQLCLQASPNDTTPYFELAAHASMVEVCVCNTIDYTIERFQHVSGLS